MKIIKHLLFLLLMLAPFVSYADSVNNSNFASGAVTVTGGTINGVVIGGTTPGNITGTNVTANTTMVLGTKSVITVDNISDTAYDATTWDNVTTIAPSKNAIRDKIESMSSVDSTKLPLAGGTMTGSVNIYIPAVDGHTDATILTVSQTSGTIINSYGRTGAVTLTLPTAISGLSFIAIIGTQHNSAWKIQRAGTDTIIKDGNPGKTYIQETNQSIGSSISCFTFQTGAATYTWMCTSGAGTWVTD